MKLPVDEIYLLSLCENSQKFETMRKRIDYMGFDVKDFRVVKHPMSNTIVSTLNHNLGGYGFAIYTGGVFNCTREEYTIIKSAYLRGLETVGIIEEDCSFLKDKKVWEAHFNNLPNDWDILRVNSLRGPQHECINRGDEYWFKQFNIIYGTGFYILNRKGMKYMIDCVDKLYQPIDNPITYPTDSVNIYIPKIELSLCLEDSLQSDIRDNCASNNVHLQYKYISHFKREDYV